MPASARDAALDKRQAVRHCSVWSSRRGARYLPPGNHRQQSARDAVDGWTWRPSGPGSGCAIARSARSTPVAGAGRGPRTPVRSAGCPTALRRWRRDGRRPRRWRVRASRQRRLRPRRRRHPRQRPRRRQRPRLPQRLRLLQRQLQRRSGRLGRPPPVRRPLPLHPRPRHHRRLPIHRPWSLRRPWPLRRPCRPHPRSPAGARRQPLRSGPLRPRPSRRRPRPSRRSPRPSRDPPRPAPSRAICAPRWRPGRSC